MYEIDSKLAQLQAEGKPIQVGLIGAGRWVPTLWRRWSALVVWRSLLFDLGIQAETAANAYKIAGYKGEVIETDDIVIAEKAIAQRVKK